MVGMNRNQTAETLFGDSLMMSAPALNVPNPRCFFSGIDASNRHVQVPFNEDMLGRHLMLLGGCLLYTSSLSQAMGRWLLIWLWQSSCSRDTSQASSLVKFRSSSRSRVVSRKAVTWRLGNRCPSCSNRRSRLRFSWLGLSLIHI